MGPPAKSFQLLEINIISAQDLEPVSKKMKTYATAWMNPKRKLSSCVDAEGNINPTWNDKFVFRVEEDFLRRDTSAVMIEIYAAHWFRDVLIGTVRVLVGNLIPPPETRSQLNGYIGMRFVALQVRRPSGRPQGILNIGVALLDPSMRSMPLYTQPAMSAVGYRDLMGDPHPRPTLPHKEDQKDRPNHHNHQPPPPTTYLKPILRRSRSERSEKVGVEQSYSSDEDDDDDDDNNSSIIIVKGRAEVPAKETSILSITECMVPLDMGGAKRIKAGKASSVISGAELRDKPKKPKAKGKASSVLSDSIISKESTSFRHVDPVADLKAGKDGEAKKEKVNAVVEEEKAVAKVGKVPAAGKAAAAWSDSEVGPSPSEVAAVMAEKKYPLEENQSSVLDGWSVDESVEGLRSKLERWRMELPPLYDRGGLSESSYRSSSCRTRRGGGKNMMGGDQPGLFSCFGSFFGIECQCVCGKPPGRKGGPRFHSPSTTPGRSFF